MTVRRVRTAASALVAAIGLLLVVGLLAPSPLGGWLTVSVVRGISMQPTMDTGDLVVSLRDGNHGIGDVVIFSTPQGDVIHRVVGGDGTTGWTTQGDNRLAIDPWTPTDAEIHGEPVLHLPGTGALVTHLQEALGPTGLVVLSMAGLLLAARPRRGRLRRPWPVATKEAALAGAATSVLAAGVLVASVTTSVPAAPVVARTAVAVGVLGVLGLATAVGHGALLHLRLRTTGVDLALGRRVVDVDDLDLGDRAVAAATNVRALRRAADHAATPVLRWTSAQTSTSYAAVTDDLAVVLTVSGEPVAPALHPPHTTVTAPS